MHQLPPEIVHQVLSEFDPIDLVIFALTSHRNYDIVCDYKRCERPGQLMPHTPMSLLHRLWTWVPEHYILCRYPYRYINCYLLLEPEYWAHHMDHVNGGCGCSASLLIRKTWAEDPLFCEEAFGILRTLQRRKKRQAKAAAKRASRINRAVIVRDRKSRCRERHRTFEARKTLSKQVRNLNREFEVRRTNLTALQDIDTNP